MMLLNKNFFKRWELLAPIFLCVFVSCGEINIAKKLKTFQSQSAFVASPENQCLNLTKVDYQQTLQEIDELYQVSLKKSQLQFSLDYLQPGTVEFDIKNPLIASKLSIQKELNQLKKWESLNISPAELQKRLYLLRIKFLRLQFNQCRVAELKQKSKNDPRAFLELQYYCQNKGANEECLKDEFLKGNRQNLKNLVLTICPQLQKKDECYLLYEIYSGKKRLDELAHQMKSRYLIDVYSKFYRLQTKSTFYCEKSSEKTMVYVPAKIEPHQEFKEQEIWTMIQNKWNNEKFEIVFVAPGTDLPHVSTPVNFQWSSQGVSFVMRDNPKNVYLAQNLTKDEARLVIPHEFGHVLGFPDCYVEYINQNDELIYFELPSKDNLMCSLKAQNKILDLYRDEFVRESCLFVKK